MKDYEYIKERYGNIIDSINNKYFYIELDFLTYKRIVEDAFEKSCNFDNVDTSFSKYLDIAMETYVYSFVKEPVNALIVLSNYIERKIKTPSSYDEAIRELKKITNFLSTIYNSYTPLHFQVFLDNLELSKIIQIVFDNNFLKIKEGKIDSIFNDEILKNLLYAYCIDKNIGFINEEETKDMVYFEDFTKQYLANLKDFLPEDEIKDLLLKVHSGDKKAREKIILHNSKLVLSIASKYTHCRSLTLLDLIQEGRIGLLKAIETFDFDRGCKFSTHATWCIRQEISRAIANNDDMIRIPVWFYEKLLKYRQVVEKLEMELGRKPKNNEIAKIMKISLNKVIEYQNVPEALMSLNMPVGENQDDDELGNLILDTESEELEDKVINKIMMEDFVKLLLSTNEISMKEKNVICLYFGIYGSGMSLEKIGIECGITWQGVSATKNRGLRKLRYSEDFKSYSI